VEGPLRLVARGGASRAALLLCAFLLVLAACSPADELAIEEPATAADATPLSPTASPPTAPAPTRSPTEATTPTATSAGDLEVHFIDAGQADATLLEHEDVTILVDTGDWRRDDVVPYLRASGVERIDVVVVTHPHADHLGQFDAVLDEFDVMEVWWSGATHTTRTFERAVAALERSGALYEEPRAGDATDVGPLRVEFINPPSSADLSDLHDSGLAFRVSYGDVRFLFTGDAEAHTEQRMVRTSREHLRADIYQVGHHGSGTSSTTDLLETVIPAVAVYSAGADNSYGHPHPDVVERLRAHGIETYGTPIHGTIVITTDGTTWTVETGRTGDVAAARAPPPSPGPAEPAVADEQPATAAGCRPGQVDVNSAPASELEEIIHIGPARAEEMLRLRPFASVGDLRRINGIADARLREIHAQAVACVP
jgi:competence protein ComEC